MSLSGPSLPATGQLESQQTEEVDESLEVSSELDDALNELGMLSSSSGAATSNDLLTRKDLLKDKLRRVRYPLRREKEREISWSSSSSSGSCSSSGYSSRRSSNSSVGSFSSLRSCHTRSPLMTQCSIAETPTGLGPGMSCFTTMSSSTSNTSAQFARRMITSQLSCSSTSSYGSSSELFVDPLQLSSSTAFKSSDVQKVIRRYHRSTFKPYVRRRNSLNINAKDRMAVFSSLGSGDTLPLRNGLSDSEASSGSGTGTPPPSSSFQQQLQHRPVSLNSGINPNFFSNIFKSNLQSEFPETKSNPSSPERTEMVAMAVNTLSNETQQQAPQQQTSQLRGGRIAGDTSGYCVIACCPFGPHPHVHSSHGVMTRSKSLDDLISISFLSDDSSSSTDCFGTNALRGGTVTGPLNAGVIGFPGPSAPSSSLSTTDSNPQYSLYSSLTTHSSQQQQQQDPFSSLNPFLNPLNAFSCSIRNSQGLPLHHHSHHHLQHPSPSTPQQPLDPGVTSSSSDRGSVCDTVLLENVLQGMNRLEMN